MFKKIVLMVVVVGLLMTGVSVFAMTKADKGGRIVTNVRVTSIKGNVITVRDDKGMERILEIKSVEGIKVGANGICQEDCGGKLKIGRKDITIQKVIK